MNEYDGKVRKQWLGVYILSTGIGAILNFLNMWLEPTFNQLPLLRNLFIGFNVLFLFIFSYIGYRCIYKKPGTKLLTFCFTMTAISLVITPVLYLSGKIHFPAYILPYQTIYLFLTQGMGFAWLFVSWRMRKTNKRLQALEKSN